MSQSQFYLMADTFEIEHSRRIYVYIKIMPKINLSYLENSSSVTTVMFIVLLLNVVNVHMQF